MEGAHPIKMSEIKAYFDVQGIEDVMERNELIDLISALDDEFLTITKERGKR